MLSYLDTFPRSLFAEIWMHGCEVLLQNARMESVLLLTHRCKLKPEINAKIKYHRQKKLPYKCRRLIRFQRRVVHNVCFMAWFSMYVPGGGRGSLSLKKKEKKERERTKLEREKSARSTSSLDVRSPIFLARSGLTPLDCLHPFL